MRGFALAVILMFLGLGAYQYIKQDPLLSVAAGINNNSKSTAAFQRLTQTMHEMAGLMNEQPAASAEAYRAVLHMLEAGLGSAFEQNPDLPEFKQIVSTTRKLLGDNPDAIYHETLVNPQLDYVIRGNMAGAVYVSLTVHSGKNANDFAGEISGVINSDQFDVAGDGSFVIKLGPQPSAERNYLQLAPDATDIIVRHYFEEAAPVAADLNRHIPLIIEPSGEIEPAPAPTDESIAAGIDRVSGYLRSRLELFGNSDSDNPAPFVSKVPNTFVKPVKPGSMAGSNADAAYSFAPYVLQEDQALVITGQMPEARMANVVLWNAYLQTYDFRHRQVSLNRRQMVYEPDGSFKILVAHRNPGHPNWLDTEGRKFGFVYWRFLLPEGDIGRLNSEVIELVD